jgi:hypothetical protein
MVSRIVYDDNVLLNIPIKVCEYEIKHELKRKLIPDD